MGQQESKEQVLIIKPSSSQLQKNLCYIDTDESGEIIELKFQDQSYEKMLESEFIKYLDQNSDKKIKIITTFGEFGQGKSFIQNFFIQSYQKKKEFSLIFPFKSNTRSITKGINFYCLENEEQKNEITVFFDCEGFDYSNKSSHMKNLQKLICLITRISTCVLYVHGNSRIPKSFDDIINLIKAKDESESQMIHNFIEVVNNWNGDEFESFQQDSHFNKIITKLFKLKQLSFSNRNKEEVEQKICKIKQDKNYEEFINEINQIAKFLKNSKYKTPYKNCKAFEQDQTCYSFKEMLLCSFQSIQENIDVSLGHFISIINEQLVQKKRFTLELNQKIEEMFEQYKISLQNILINFSDTHISLALIIFSFRQFVLNRQDLIRQNLQQFMQKWKQEFQAKLNQIITINSINLSDQSKELIIQKYSNFQSFKPKQIKMIEVFQEYENKKCSIDFFKLFFFIILVQFSGFFISTIGLLGLKFIKLFNDKKLKMLQNNLIDHIISKIRYFTKGNSQQNIQHLREILFNYSSQQQLAQQSDFAVFLTFFNLSHTSVLNFINYQKGFEVDNQVLQSCIQIFKEDNNIQSLNLKLIYKFPSIKIKDSDFEFYEDQQVILFISQQLNDICSKNLRNINQHEQELYKMLFFLKNRNIDLLQTFICYTYFDDFINSQDFVEKMNDQREISELIKFQKSLI